MKKGGGKRKKGSGNRFLSNLRQSHELGARLRRFGTLSMSKDPGDDEAEKKNQNISVYCRFRPKMGKSEAKEADGYPMEIESNTSVRMLRVEDKAGTNRFAFDTIFGVDSRQEDVYAATVQPLLPEVFAGYNCTIFAYGQTGSGKTHTMMGDIGTDQRGVIPRLAHDIFVGINDADDTQEFTLRVEFLEIYMERVSDLLNPRQDNLQIRETSDGDLYVEGCTEQYVSSYEQILDIIKRGEKNRHIGQTRMNMQSSRSHSVFMLHLTQRDTTTGTKKTSKLIMVDLAGSEKVAKSNAAGMLLKEAQHINKSLSALGNVINHLTSGKPHVPYRDSKLTRLLTDSLGGNSKTSLIITASPSHYNADETLSTLRFGARAKMIKNKPKVNQERSITEYQSMLMAAKRQIKKQKTLIASLKADARALKETLQRLDPNIDIDAMNLGSLDGGQDGRGAGGDSVVSSSLIEELQEKVEALELRAVEEEERSNMLQEQMLEKDSELDIHVQLLGDREEEVNQLRVELELIEERNAELEQKVAEYAVFRKKVEIMEAEYVIQLDELELENADLTEKLHALLLNEIESRAAQAKRARQRKQHRPRRISEDSGKPGTERKKSSGPSYSDAQAAARIRELERDNQRLQVELERKNQLASDNDAAVQELSKSISADKVDLSLRVTALTQENAQLHYEMSKVKRQITTQDKLLKNRQSHVEVLELALEEANILHKKMTLDQRQQIETLQTKLELAQQLFEELYEQESSGRGRTDSAHVIVPMRGQKHNNTPSM